MGSGPETDWFCIEEWRLELLLGSGRGPSRNPIHFVFKMNVWKPDWDPAGVVPQAEPLGNRLGGHPRQKIRATR